MTAVVHHEYCDAINPGPELGPPTKPCNCGADRTRHVGEVFESFLKRNDYQAGCRCGFQGPTRATVKEAKVDLDAHYGISGL